MNPDDSIESAARPISTAAGLATSTPADLTRVTAETTARVRARIARLVAGEAGADGLTVLDVFDEAATEMTNLGGLASLIGKAHPDPDMRAAGDEAMAAMSRLSTDVSMDAGVYTVLSALDVADADAATRHYLARTLRTFRRSGVDRDDATRARLRATQEKIVATGQAFGRNIRDDVKSLAIEPAALDGLPEDYLRTHRPGDDGLVTITTEYPDLVPFLSYARDAGARERLWRLDRQRAWPANVDVLADLLRYRREYANLLGFPTWAEYVTGDKMIGTEQAAADFIDGVSRASKDRCDREYADLLAHKRVDDPDAEAVHPWDARYLQDRVRAERFAFDTQSVRPYFEYTRVKAGLMGLVERMFGVVFRTRDDVPVWHSDVTVHEMTDASTGALLGRIFLDMHPRAGKYTHAAMFQMVTGKAGVDADTTRVPECALLCNLPRPGDEPALLSHTDLTTFFHEFGHVVHHVLGGHQRWAGISGVETEWDFVEAPSQLLEEWTLDAATLAGFATHHETGESLPAETVAKLRASGEFGKGLQIRQQMFYATLSLELYRQDPIDLDPIAVETTAMATHTPYRHVEGTYAHLSFGHLDGYSAVYYTYMWSLVIAKDLFTRFAAEGLPAPETCAAYRQTILAAGGSAPAAELVRAFLGRDYTVAAFEAWLSL